MCKPLRRQRRQLPCKGSHNNELRFSEITPNKGTDCKMLQESSILIDEAVDSLRVYVLDDIIDVYTWGIGERKETDCVIL